jgi:glycerol-3-phosphate O-acyltransferase
MAQHAESRNEPLHAIRRKADKYLDEMAAKYNHFFINIIAKPIGWVLNTMFEGTVVDDEGLQRIKTMSLNGPIILIPCHKSHIDYLILSYVLYQHNMPAPHIAAGKNLSFWPMGPLARAGGAFFLRRTFRGAVLYSKVFTEYIPYRQAVDAQTRLSYYASQCLYE